jgi:hypothetical protein
MERIFIFIRNLLTRRDYSQGAIMEEYSDRYGIHFVRLIDSRVTMKAFEFDRILLMPTARGYRALVVQAKVEIKPRIMNYLSKTWSAGAIENLSSFAMAAAIYARSVSDPPYIYDVGKVLLRTAAFCNLRCFHRKETGGGCRAAMNKEQHHLPRCMKLPRDICVSWGCLKRYIASGKAISTQEALSLYENMSVKVDPDSDFAPATSC